MPIKAQYLVPRFDPQGHIVESLRLPRESMRDDMAQSALSDARSRGINVECLCHGETPLLLSIVPGTNGKFHLSRRPSDAGRHAHDCPHGSPSKSDLASKGYATTAVGSTDSGSCLIRIGSLLASGPAADEEPEYVESDGSGSAAPQRLRSSAGLMGLLSWLLHKGKLNIFDRSRGVFDFWNELYKTALELHIDGLNALGPLSSRLLLGPTGYNDWHPANATVVADSARRTGLLVLFAPITRSAIPQEGLIDLSDRFGVRVVMKSETLSKALRARKFARERYLEGRQFLAFGRAYPTTLQPAGNPSTDNVWMIDRLALMATEPTLFPVARKGDLAKALKALKAFDWTGTSNPSVTYEGYLPYDK